MKIQASLQLSNYLPYYLILNGNIILTKSGMLLQVIVYQGYTHEIDKDKAEESSQYLTNALHLLGEGWVIWFDIHRRKINETEEDVFTNTVAQYFDALRIEYYQTNQHYRTFKFMVLGYQLPTEHLGLIDKLVYQGNLIKNFRITMKGYQDKATQFFGLLDKTSLANYDILSGDMLVTYLHSCVSTKQHSVAYESSGDDQYLDFILGNIEVKTDYPVTLNDRTILTSTIAGFPSYTYNNMLDALNYISEEFRYTTRHICLNKEESLKRLKQRRITLFSKRRSVLQSVAQEDMNMSTLDNIEDTGNLGTVEDAIVRTGSDEIRFGYLTSTLTTWSDSSEQEAEQIMESITKTIERRGFTCKRETLQSFESYLSTLPGDIESNVRRPILSTKNVAHLASLNEVYNGYTTNEHLLNTCGNGSPLISATTKGSNVYFFNLHNKDVGHTFVGGPTGSGKSTLLATILIQFLRYKNAQLYVFDVGRSLKPLCQALHGNIYDITKENNIMFQPLAKINDTSLIFSLNYIKLLCTMKGHTPSVEEERSIEDALVTLHSRPAVEHTITNFLKLCQNKTIKAVLDQYQNPDIYGKFFDGANDFFGNNDISYFEMDALLEYGDDVIIPSLIYLFNRIERQFTGMPSLIILDECWKYLKNPIFQTQIQSWIKTLRKKNASIILATQELDDILTSDIASTIITNCPTTILLPNPKAKYSVEGYRKMGLSDEEIRIIETAKSKEQYYVINEENATLMNLNLTDEMLEVLFGTNTY